MLAGFVVVVGEGAVFSAPSAAIAAQDEELVSGARLQASTGREGLTVPQDE